MSIYFSLGLYFTLGVIFWTILEYFLHRFLGHWKKGKNVFTVEHLRHHRETDYFAPAYKKAIAAFIVLALSFLIFGAILGWVKGFSFAFGLALMYGIYEIIHKRSHTHAPINGYGRWNRKHHFYHHFKNPKMNHGVTSPIWDIVFGTNVKPDTLLVPRKLALDWLIDPVTKALLPMFSDDYQLRGGGTAEVK